MLVMGDPQHPYYQGILRQAHGPVRGQEIEIKPNVSKVWEEMADADILFAPSTWESMGIAVCEAMAAGLCVVASRIEANIPLLGQGCGPSAPPKNLRTVRQSAPRGFVSGTGGLLAFASGSGGRRV